jgi:large subunit ribosomal protein L6
MSRVAKKPIVVPQGVTVDLSAGHISVKGPLGVLDFAVHSAVSVEQEGDSLLCKPVAGVAQADALSGTVGRLSRIWLPVSARVSSAS